MDRNLSVESQPMQELKSLFDEVDSDNNGYVSYRELRSFLASNDHKLPSDVLDKVYASADRNGDGRLDFREFATMVYDPRNRDFFLDLFRTCLNKLTGAGKQYVNFMLPPQPTKYTRSYSVDEAKGPEYVDLLKCCPPPIFMIVISVVEIVLFAIDAVDGNTSGTGTVARALIYDTRKRSEVWRYITYMFVHVGYIHLGTNLLIQVCLGVLLEVYNGWWRVLLIYFAGVLAGSLGTFVFHSVHQLAGASGGVYSLITAHIATIILNWSQMDFALPNLTIFLAFAVGDLVHVFHVADPTVGHTAHFCGAAAGLLVGVLILRNISSNRTERILQLIALIVYIGAMAAAILWNILR